MHKKEVKAIRQYVYALDRGIETIDTDRIRLPRSIYLIAGIYKSEAPIWQDPIHRRPFDLKEEPMGPVSFYVSRHTNNLIGSNHLDRSAGCNRSIYRHLGLIVGNDTNDLQGVISIFRNESINRHPENLGNHLRVFDTGLCPASFPVGDCLDGDAQLFRKIWLGHPRLFSETS